MDYGIKIAKSGNNVFTAEKKDLIIISTAEAHKVIAEGTVTSNTNIAHGMGHPVFCEAYGRDGSNDVYKLQDPAVDEDYVYLTVAPYSIVQYIIFSEGE